LKLPRDVSGAELEKALKRTFGYIFLRQVGSHRRLRTQNNGEHHVTVPMHKAIKPGTLRNIIGAIASHHEVSVEEVLEKLDL
jgi:predicted RNA binding protein YcfA (HicA-like mRNA interferase family)